MDWSKQIRKTDRLQPLCPHSTYAHKYAGITRCQPGRLFEPARLNCSSVNSVLSRFASLHRLFRLLSADMGNRSGTQAASRLGQLSTCIGCAASPVASPVSPSCVGNEANRSSSEYMNAAAFLRSTCTPPPESTHRSTAVRDPKQREQLLAGQASERACSRASTQYAPDASRLVSAHLQLANAATHSDCLAPQPGAATKTVCGAECSQDTALLTSYVCSFSLMPACMSAMSRSTSSIARCVSGRGGSLVMCSRSTWWMGTGPHTSQQQHEQSVRTSTHATHAPRQTQALCWQIGMRPFT